MPNPPRPGSDLSPLGELAVDAFNEMVKAKLAERSPASIAVAMARGDRNPPRPPVVGVVVPLPPPLTSEARRNGWRTFRDSQEIRVAASPAAWTPIDEPPDVDGSYLVALDRAVLGSRVHAARFKDGRPHTIATVLSDDVSEKVTHWMPLPEPPP